MKNFNVMFNTLRNNISKHSPEILTTIGISGMLASTVLAVKATPKAFEILEANKKKDENIDIKKVVKLTWKEYIPSASLSLASIFCLVGAISVSTKRTAALSTAYTITSKSFDTYKKKVIETIGEKKEKDIRDQIAQDRVDNDSSEKRQIIVTPSGQTLCLDSISGRYFRSDLDTIRKAVNELNREMLSENYISLNKLYSAIGLDGIKNGDHIGWNVDNGLIELDFDACITDTDEPCIVIDYNIMPRDGYNIFM